MIRALLAVLLLSGCTPYVGYTHLSNPLIDNDGYDLACGGAKINAGLQLSAAVCHNLAPNGGTLVKIDVEYTF